MTSSKVVNDYVTRIGFYLLGKGLYLIFCPQAMIGIRDVAFVSCSPKFHKSV